MSNTNQPTQDQAADSKVSFEQQCARLDQQIALLSRMSQIAKEKSLIEEYRVKELRARIEYIHYTQPNPEDQDAKKTDEKPTENPNPTPES
jgi:uncharacterized protein